MLRADQVFDFIGHAVAKPDRLMVFRESEPVKAFGLPESWASWLRERLESVSRHGARDLPREVQLRPRRRPTPRTGAHGDRRFRTLIDFVDSGRFPARPRDRPRTTALGTTNPVSELLRAAPRPPRK